MSFGREKRMWLAALALLAPVPLPFNQVLEWPYLFAYSLFIIHFLQRVERGAWITLSNGVLNLLGLVSLPFIAADLRASFLRGSVVTALSHLMMFLLVVKLYSIRREKDKWHIMVAIYFLFVGSMATSSHVTIAPYLVAFLILSLLILGRFTHLHALAPFGEHASEAKSPPYRAPLVIGSLLVVMVAVPLFATMPRIREPYILGRGTGSGGMARTTGFSDSVNLSLTTSIRSNRSVAMRVKFEDDTQPVNGANLRFKGASYDLYQDRNWFRANSTEVLEPESTAATNWFFELAQGVSPVNKAEIFLQPIGSSSLLLPMAALSVELDVKTRVGRDPGGAVRLSMPPPEPIHYEVTLAAEPVIIALLEYESGSGLLALDQSGLTPPMADLARQVMGGDAPRDGTADGDSVEAGVEASGGAPSTADGSEAGAADDGGSEAGAADDGAADDGAADDGAADDGEPLTDDQRIDRLERHLLTQYTYTVDFLGRSGESPLEDFLFVYKSGHCELFASAMVLMLRSQGIPARLVTGFLGAELNPLEGYYAVRQQNAHAWVEAYSPSRGWRVYDPTPPDGRPAIPPQSLALLMNQIYDYVTFRWDRYVLTYGAADQDSFFRKLRSRLRQVWGKLKDLTEEEPAESPFPVAAGSDDEVESPWVWQPSTSLPVLLAIFAVAATALVSWNRRRPMSGQAAYIRLRRGLGHSGLEISATLAPLDLLERAVERFPSAAGALRHIVGHYVRESFAGHELGGSERKGLQDALRSVAAELAEDRRRQRRERWRKRMPEALRHTS